MTTLHPGRPRIYTFSKMRVGESVFMPCECDGIRKWQKRITSAAARQVGRYGCFSVVQRSIKGVDDVRVTRTG